MRNAIKAFREKAGMNKAELSRRTGIGQQQLGRLESGKRALKPEYATEIAKALNCTAQELMFPEMAAIDTKQFSAVFDIAAKPDPSNEPEIPLVAFDINFLAQILPTTSGENLRLMMVDTAPPNGIVTKGDAVVIDLDENTPTRPGLYALEIAGVTQWRYLTLTTTGMVQVQSESAGAPNEIVSAKDLTVIGRGRLRISTL